MSRYGITPETTVVFYGDKNNWYAAYSFWLFRMYGHRDLRLMNGGRVKWEAEDRLATRRTAFPLDKRPRVTAGLAAPRRPQPTPATPRSLTPLWP